MAQDTVQKSMTLLPQYQEDFLKNLLANVFQTEDVLDAEGNVIGQEISGFATQNPLLGTPQFNEDGTFLKDVHIKGKKYYDEQGWEISPPISDRECIYRCLENCEDLAGLDKKQVQRLMEDFKTKKTEFVRNEEYPVL